MSVVDVHFDMSELERAIGSIYDQIQDVALPIIGETISSAVDEVIQSEGAAGFRGPWPPFSLTTFKIHPRRIGGKLLQDTGLLASIQIDTGPDWVEVASPAPYAAAQQEGVAANPLPGCGPIPPRDFMAIYLEDVLEEAATSILEEALR